MEKRTFRAVFDNGDLYFAEPVHMEGCWKVEVTFIEQEDVEPALLEANPHAPELGPAATRLEEFHNRAVDKLPPRRPY